MSDPELIYQPQNNHGISQDIFEEMQREAEMPTCRCCHEHHDDADLIDLNNHLYCEACVDDAENELDWDLEKLVGDMSNTERDYVIELLEFQKDGEEKFIEKLRKAIRADVRFK